tara:strand:- start:378 stop:617 length:240 start_codon:yes stop_codon:yes gene_type:complete
MNDKYLIEMADQEQSEIDKLNEKLNSLLIGVMRGRNKNGKCVDTFHTVKIFHLFNDMLRQSHKDRCYIDILLHTIKEIK